MAKTKIGARAPRNVGGRPRSEAVFSGLLVCEACGQAMYTETATGRGDVRYHYYNCRAFLKGLGCESRRVPVEVLDTALLESIAGRIFTPENIAGILLEMKSQSSAWAREKQERIDALANDLADVDRRLRRLYETIEAGAGLTLHDVAPRLRQLRERQGMLQLESERLDADPGPQVSLGANDSTMAARVFRDVLLTAENPARVREFIGHFVTRAVVGREVVTLEYLPERIVNTRLGDSQCAVRWLPDRSTLRTARIEVRLQKRLRRAG